MSYQDTVLELFETKRIDKAAAYRLLKDMKTRQQPERQAAGPQSTQQCSLSVKLRAALPWRLMLLCYLVHIAQGKERVILAVNTPRKSWRVVARINDGMTPRQLFEAVRKKYTPDAAGPAQAPYAWVSAGCRDSAERRIRFSELPAQDDNPRQLLLEASWQPHAEGATSPEDWADCLEHWDQQFHRHLDLPLKEIDRLPPRHHQLLKQYNRTQTFISDQPVAQALIDPVIQRRAGEIAVRTSRQEIDYAEYGRHAWRLGHQLRALGAKRGDMVAVLLQRNATMPASLYGVLCAGASYVPLEPDLPDERLAMILHDTGARYLLTDADTLFERQLPLQDSAVSHLLCADRWPRGLYQTLPVHDLSSRARFPAEPPPLLNEADDLAYTIFTSGSTGKPKGVMISHRSMINSVVGLNNVFQVAGDDRIMAFSSYSFDLSVWDIFGAALAGAMLILPDRQQRQQPDALWAMMHDSQATVWNSVPTAMSQMMVPFHDGRVKALSSLRIAMLGGEFTPPALIGDVARAFPCCQLANGGGATEGTIYSNFYFPVSRFAAHWKSIPYGVPLPNQQLHVLNSALKPCAIGEKGMIWIGGQGVALGYLGDPEKTRAAFRQAPWSDDPAERIYRTGDLGIMRADGLIEICGRADRQVKLRGYRIELGEVENALSTLEGIDQCAVVLQRVDGQATRLVGCYLSRRGDLGDPAIRRHLARQLPAYMIPDQFLLVEDPPFNASGKLDARQLEQRLAQKPGGEAAAGAQAPENDSALSETESELAHELARILRIRHIGVDDDFFLMGGDSLLTLQYISALGRLGLSATPQDIQQGRSIRGVLARVQASTLSRDSAHEMTVGLTPMGRKFFERLPLSNRDHWQQLLMLRFDHLPDIERLNHAMSRVHAHHPLLRAYWNEGALQVPEAMPADIEVVDLRHVPLPFKWLQINREVAELRQEASLQSDCLSGARLIRLGERDVRLYWVMHHLIIDANCWRILVDDLATAYRNTHASLLPAGRIQDLIERVDARVEEALAGLQARRPWQRMPIPRIRNRNSTGMEADARTIRLVLSRPQTRRMYEALRGETNLNLLLLGTLSLALRRWAQQDSVRFDIISNGRSVDESLDLARSVGWIATHNPFEVTLHSQQPSKVLSAVRKSWQRYQEESPFFVAACNAAHERDEAPLCHHVDQALLYSFLGDFDSLSLPDGWQIAGSHGRNRAPENPRTHELEMEVLVVDGRLMLRLVYPRSQIRASQARALIGHYRQSLNQLITFLETR